ncbi:hypothetical protein EON79_13780, partial [bacterium]
MAPTSDAPPAAFAYLRDKRLLLLLDGIDGLVHAGDAGFMHRLLEASEGVSVLSTSRLRPVLP